MKLFTCSCCDQLLHFENTQCVGCSRRLGYIPQQAELSALDPTDQPGIWRALAGDQGQYRFCSNADYDACNWLVPADSAERVCSACRHNRIIPDLTDDTNLRGWQKIEAAKHRLIYTLERLGLPRPALGEGPEPLVFDFLADPPASEAPKVMTGHDNGVITIAIAEADDPERERRKAMMGEPYRTLIGHFRHEVGHFYWDILVRDGGALEECRAVFGDDREDYEAALQRHYDQGVPANWQENFISAYATTHAWEDFAETWAHYLHIIDTLEMADSFRMGVAPPADRTGTLSARAEIDVYRAATIEDLVGTWIPLAFALNSMNRCMGQADLYPFVLSPTVIAKLGFIHRLVGSRREAAEPLRNAA